MSGMYDAKMDDLDEIIEFLKAEIDVPTLTSVNTIKNVYYLVLDFKKNYYD